MLCLSDAALHALLLEDGAHGDLTTDSLGIGARPGAMRFFARGPMTVCGIEEAERLCHLAGCDGVQRAVSSGDAVAAETLLLTARGQASALHRAWKVAQTLVEATSGIASETAAITAAARAENPQAVVATTRKAFPGTRAMALKAVRAGGGIAHRTGLSETLLVFAEHRAFLTEAEALIHLDRLRAHCPEKRVVAEVTTPEEARKAVEGGVDVLQLEHFSAEGVQEIHDWLVANDLDRRVVLAAAGGLNARNAAEYVRAGCRILVTSAPYLARPRDVKVVITAQA